MNFQINWLFFFNFRKHFFIFDAKFEISPISKVMKFSEIVIFYTKLDLAQQMVKKSVD